MPSPLVNALSRFNRKERFWLLSDAIGVPFLSLSPLFLDKLQQELNASIPADAWWAFDYHIDWLHAALHFSPKFDLLSEPAPKPNAEKCIQGTQEDVDLIVAFEKTIIFVEAKLSTSWSTAQLERKLKRLRSLPAGDYQRYFVLTSPTRPKRLDTSKWPEWSLKPAASTPTFYHIPLRSGVEGVDSLVVSRCLSDNTKSENGDHWNIYPE